MRVADADLLPYDFRDLATTVAGYSREVKGLVKQMQEAAAMRQKDIDAGYYSLAADPTKSVKLPEALPNPPEFDFSGLDAAIAKLKTAAAELKAAEDSAGPLDAKKADAINLQLAMAEHRFLNPAGLPRRPWVKHVLYAPGWYTGYGAKTMPGVTEAIEDGRFDEAKQQMVIVTHAVEAEAEHLERIARELRAK
jgi:N-acetylated-alpha-linked acidic dipeptidase